MALTDKLTAIAEAIREKTGKTDTMLLADMPEEIANIKSETLLKPTEYPDYVRTEIMRVANDVREVLTDDSFVSICLSDSHYPIAGDGSTSYDAKNALRAIKGLTHLIPVDFIAHLGDIGGEGKNSTTTEYLETTLKEMADYLKESRGDSIPLFAAIGNHDCGNYITENDVTDQIPGEWLYNHFTALSKSDNTVFSGQNVGGYCYRDFPNRKIRIFLLNTSEEIIAGRLDNGTSVTQRAWVAQQLQNLNSKTDASEWSFIVLCHYPLDYGGSKTLSNVFEAYVNGTSIVLNGTTYNFNGKNSARFLVQYHGHIHNFLMDRIYGGPVGAQKNGNPGTQYNAYRVAIPNAQPKRENYYYYNESGRLVADSDGTRWGIKFFEGEYSTQGIENASYHKESGTAKDTSFVVNVINPSEEKIYSIAYGAGYNRVLGIGDITYYNIQTELSNVLLSNSITSIEAGKNYETEVTLANGYSIKELVITMNDVPVENAYLNGKIIIPNVSGNVYIKLTAGVGNLHLLALDYGTTENVIYNNGLGYMNNCRTSGSISDGIHWGDTDDAAGLVFTGMIPWDRTSAIHISGGTFPYPDGRIRINFHSARVGAGTVRSPWINNDDPAVNSKADPITDYFAITNGPRNGITLTPLSSWNVNSNIKWFGMTLKGKGEDIIVTFGDDTGENITNYKVTNNLTNITTNNNAASITEGANYIATLTPISGYKITNVVVTMGGTAIENAYNSSTGIITVNNVTGDIVITATATQVKIYTITYNLTNVTSSDTSTSVIENHSYSTDLIVNSGCTMSTVKITMGGIDITNNALTDDFIAIGPVTGNIIITAIATLNNYTITNTLTKVTNSNTATSINYGSQYSATLTPASGYKLSSATVKMGGTDITSTAYSNGTINISSVTGNIVITATAIEATYTVTYNLTKASSSNTNTAVSGSGYTTTLTANDNCVLDSVKITMGGTDITSSAYTSSTGVVNITTVTGNIVITVVANIYNYIRLAVDRPDGTLKIGEKGYRAGLRFSSSNGYDPRDDANYCSTGFIEVPEKATIRIKNATLASSSTSNGYINLYMYKAIGATNIVINYNTLISNTTNGITTITIADSSIKYIALCCATIDDSTIITVNRPIT